MVGADHVVEHVEVADQDLVHPSKRLKDVQIVLVGLVLEVPRLIGEPRRGGMHGLAGIVEHAGDRVLGEPVDLQVRMMLPQLSGDSQVASGVPEPDWGGEVERLLRAAPGPHPRGAWPGRPPRVDRVGELSDQVVDLDRVTPDRRVAAAIQKDELAAGELDETLADDGRTDAVLGPVDGQHRALDAAGDVLRRSAPRVPEAHAPGNGVHGHLRRGLVSPPDAVLDLLGGVGFGEDLAEEELQEVVVPAFEPVVAVELGPPLGGVEA